MNREPSTGTKTYDQTAKTFARDLVATRKATPEQVDRLSGLVRKSASELADKVIRLSEPRTKRQAVTHFAPSTRVSASTGTTRPDPPTAAGAAVIR